MAGLLGTKVEMTSIFGDEGAIVPCTLIQVGPCVVTQKKSKDKDGYDAIQLGYGEKKEKNTTKPMKKHFEKSGASPKSVLAEFKGMDNLNVGDVVTSELIKEGDKIAIVGTSKGKGFQGVVKRHGFHGGPKTHGQKNRLRAPGSIGATHPQHVTKGKKMAGRMGHEIINLKKCKIMQIDTANNILAIRGAVPGKKGDLIEIVGK